MTPVQDAAPPVRVRRVRRSHGSLVVLDDVSFEVLPGERFCLIGANGAGKSTLLAILAGVRRPDAGEATLFGCDPADPALKPRRGIQLERPYFPYYAKVREIVWLFSGMHPHEADGPKLIERFRLRGDAYVRHLSKGQRQRLALLLATIGDPELLILDEPTSGLDPEAKLGLWKAIDQHLREVPARALLFTTHELSEAEQWAHRVAVLHRGRVAAIGTPAELCRTLVGTEMKLTIVTNGRLGAEQIIDTIPPHLIEGVRLEGDEATIYTDYPKKILELLPIEETRHLHVRHVSLEDVYFSVTQAGSHARAVAQPQ